jgi:methylenetetrahydrofolate dehydrogenase (NADP+) / methenyltetrahydrofolate cyclohydrolase
MIIDGKKVADEIQREIKEKVRQLASRPPCIAVVLVGNHPPSEIYVNRKTQACEAVGIHSIKIVLPEEISEADLLAKVKELNEDPNVDGILVQLPLPPHINPMRITHFIHPDKDVDGFNPYNMGRMLIGETDGFIPCTPLGIKVLIERYSIDISGRHALVIGRSNIVGKPMAALLMQGTPGGNATVTVAHRYSEDLKKFCQLADIIVVAVGQPRFITADMVKEGAVVIDVGINKIDDPTKKSGYQIVGDVDFDNVAPKCSFITPVPGGVGPMTIAMLLQNTLLSYQQRMKREGSQESGVGSQNGTNRSL